MVDMLDVHNSIQGSAKEVQLGGTNSDQFQKAGDGGNKHQPEQGLWKKTEVIIA